MSAILYAGAMATCPLYRHAKISHLCLVALLTAMASPQALRGQVYGTASHTVTVSVQPVTVMQVNGGTINLGISGSNAVAGQDQMSVSDQTTSLLWGTNSSLQKITISTSLGAPLFTLQAQAVNATVGSPNPQLTVSTAPADLLLNIGRSSGSCNIQYTGIALASQGTGSDAHVITFTILAQ